MAISRLSTTACATRMPSRFARVWLAMMEDFATNRRWNNPRLSRFIAGGEGRSGTSENWRLSHRTPGWRGGMGVVYEAEQSLAALPSRCCRPISPTNILRFKERQRRRPLASHPYCRSLASVGQYYYYVMQFIHGQASTGPRRIAPHAAVGPANVMPAHASRGARDGIWV